MIIMQLRKTFASPSAWPVGGRGLRSVHTGCGVLEAPPSASRHLVPHPTMGWGIPCRPENVRASTLCTLQRHTRAGAADGTWEMQSRQDAKTRGGPTFSPRTQHFMPHMRSFGCWLYHQGWVCPYSVRPSPRSMQRPRMNVMCFLQDTRPS